MCSLRKLRLDREWDEGRGMKERRKKMYCHFYNCLWLQYDITVCLTHHFIHWGFVQYGLLYSIIYKVCINVPAHWVKQPWIEVLHLDMCFCHSWSVTKSWRNCPGKREPFYFKRWRSYNGRLRLIRKSWSLIKGAKVKLRCVCVCWIVCCCTYLFAYDQQWCHV